MEICLSSEKIGVQTAVIELLPSTIVINKEVLSSCAKTASELSIFSNDVTVRKISSDAFTSFTNLRILHIETHLTDIDDIIWSENLANINKLSITNSELKRLPLIGFLSNMTQLEYLSLTGNQITHLPPNFFASIPNLKLLDLSRNPFLHFPHLNTTTVIDIRIDADLIVCSCTNVFLSQQSSFIGLKFSEKCFLPPCNYSLSFKSGTQNSSLDVYTAGKFTLECAVDASTDVGFGIISPIGFIVGPFWDSTSSIESVKFSYVVKPVLEPVNMSFSKVNATLAYFTVDYIRGHHTGEWQCVVKSAAHIYLDSNKTFINVKSGVQSIFNSTLIFGFSVMISVLLLGILIGSIRYLKETHCFQRPQLHKYVGQTLIGVIPVPGPKEYAKNKTSPFPDNIALDQRVCLRCMSQKCFFCGHCQSVHVFNEFEIIPSINADNLTQSPEVIQLTGDRSRKSNSERDYPAESGSPINPLLEEDQVEVSTSPTTHLTLIHSDILSTVQPTAINCMYEFPTEYCHCYHMVECLRMNANPEFEPAMRNVKLIVPDEKLAQEYTEALQELEAAAKANDAANFRDHLEAFRSKLVNDVGAGVRVVREEFSALRKKSVKSVAFLKDTSTAAAQKMRAGLKDGMRSVAELCRAGTSHTLGQSISVVSLYKDINDQTKERCVSEFHF